MFLCIASNVNYVDMQSADNIIEEKISVSQEAYIALPSPTAPSISPPSSSTQASTGRAAASVSPLQPFLALTVSDYLRNYHVSISTSKTSNCRFHDHFQAILNNNNNNNDQAKDSESDREANLVACI